MQGRSHDWCGARLTQIWATPALKNNNCLPVFAVLA